MSNITLSKKTVASAALAMAMLGGAAAASEDEYQERYEGRGPVPFESMDLNENGVVTADEHPQVHRERHEYREHRGYPMRNAAGAGDFDRIDADHDGSLSRGEHPAWQAQRVPQRATGWDR